MRLARYGSIGILAMGVIAGGAAVTAARAQDLQLPDCTRWNTCNPGREICTFESVPAYYGSTVIADRANGLASDGLGPYRDNTAGVGRSGWCWST